MAPPAGPADRYEPLPGLLGLPGYLWRKLSPRGRRIAGAIGVLLLGGAIAATIVLAPRIAESKRERAAEERRDRARSIAAERARLAAEQRPRRGRVEAGGGAAALRVGIEAAITRDSRARAVTGEFDRAARHTECRSIGRDRMRLVFGCTAVTSDVDAAAGSGGLLIGYPYRAAGSPDSGRYAFCKTSGRPGEGLHSRERIVELPRVCGGGL